MPTVDPTKPASSQLTREELMEYLLNITAEDVINIRSVQDPKIFSDFWVTALTYLAGITRIVSGDSAEVKANKKLDYVKGRELWAELLDTVTLNDVGVDRENVRKIEQATIGALRDGESQVRDFDLVRIGTWGFGPDELRPDDIRVSEVYGISQIATVRSEVDVAYRTPRSLTKIIINMTFSGEHRINTKLRPMLAHLYVAPITTIESPFLTNILVNAYAAPEIEAEIKQRVLESNAEVNTILDSLNQQARSEWDRMKEILQSDDLVVEFLQAKIAKERDLKRQGPQESPSSRTRSLDEVLQLGVQIPVVLTDVVVHTDPRAVNTLHTQFVFVRYNSAAFGITGLQFRDHNGDPTPDINQCPWIDELARLTYLNPNKDKYYMAPFEPGSGPDFSCIWRDVFNRSGEDLDVEGKSPEGVPGYRVFPSERVRGSYVVESVQAVISTGIAVLPVLGSKYPAVQLLGAPSFQAKVILATTSQDVVRHVHIMKDHLDAVARNLGAMGRDEELKIKNAVLNCLGTSSFVISAVETYPYPETTNAYRIELDLAHARYARRDTIKNVVLEESGAIPIDLFRGFLSYLYSKYEQYFENPNEGHGAEIKAAMTLLFGSQGSVDDSDSGNGIINHSTFMAAVLRGASGGAPGWDFFEKVNEVYRKTHSDGRGDWIGPNAIFQAVEHFPRRRYIPEEARLYGFAPRTTTVDTDYDPLLMGPVGVKTYSELQRDAIEDAIHEAIKEGDDDIGEEVIEPASRATHVKITRPLFDNLIEVLLEMPDNVRSVDDREDPIWRRTQILNAYQTVTSMFSSGNILLFAGFDGIQKYIDQQVNQQITSRQQFSNYPDLQLPTYQQMFSASSPVDTDLGRPLPFVNTNMYESMVSAAIWYKFAPTYFDLGKTPPNPFLSLRDPTGSGLSNFSKVARRYDDHVEPGFFYHHDRVKEKLFQTYKNVTGAEAFSPERYADIYRSGREGIKVLHLNRDTESLVGATDETFYDLLKEAVSAQDEDSQLARDIRSDKVSEVVHVVDNTGKIVYILEPVENIRGGRYTPRLVTASRPIYSNEQLGVGYERYDAGRAKALLEDSLEKAKDQMYSPIRHYPAFRLYFVEFDDNIHRDGIVRGVNALGIRLIDDLYSTNAVLSFNVTLSKEDAAIAEITLLNTSGEFDQDEFITEEEARNRANGEPQLGIDDEGEDYLRRIRLQTGTGIVLKIGYSSDPEDLDTVFTGQIVEVQHGDIVRIVCQGYKAELFQEVSYHNNSANGRVALREMLNKMILPHLGRVYDIRDISDEQFRELAGDTLTRDATGFFSRAGPIGRLFGGRFSTVDRNIWWENYDDLHGLVSNAILGTLESLNLRADREWLFHQVTGWDAIQEICRHYPGIVADVRPYNNEATLFVGFPDQMYNYRDPKLDELIAYEKYVSEALPLDISKVALSLIRKFWASKYGYGLDNGAFAETEKSRFTSSVNVQKIRAALDTGVAPEEVIVSLAVADRIDNVYTPLYWYFGQYDWTGDLEYLNSFYPELVRIMFAYFFQFKQDGLFGDPSKQRSGGILDGIWRQYSRTWMEPLVSPPEETDTFFDRGDEDDLIESLTQPGKDLYNLTKGDSSPLRDAVSTVRQQLSNSIQSGTFSELDPADRTKLLADLKDLERVQLDLNDRGDRFVDSGYGTIGDVLWGTSNNQTSSPGIWKFRAFIHYMVLFLKDNGLTEVEQREIQQASSRISQYRVPPGYRVFRTHHMVYDRTDIIANNIVATMREMANTVAVRAPDKNLRTVSSDGEAGESSTILSGSQEWVYFPSSRGAPFLPQIDTSQRKLYVATEPNANRKSAMANCLVSNMALAMRPMYRGDIKLIGRHVQPWDIIHIYDNYNVIYGPIEVDRVTHEFSRDLGWITTVEPHLYAVANDASDFFQTSVWQDVLSVVSTALDVATVIGIAIVIATGVGAVAAAGLAAGSRLLASRIAIAGAQNLIRKDGVKRSLLLGARTAAKRTAGVAVGGTKLFAKGLVGANSWIWGRAAMSAKFLTGISILNQVAAPSLLNALTNISIMAELNNRKLPIQLKPLTHKGMPMLAGLKLRDHQIIGFGEMVGGAVREIYQTIERAFGGTDSGIVSVPRR